MLADYNYQNQNYLTGGKFPNKKNATYRRTAESVFIHSHMHEQTDRRRVKMSLTAGRRLRQHWQLSPGFSSSGSAEAATDVPLNAPNILVCMAINRSMKTDENHTLRRTQPPQSRMKQSALGMGTNPQLNALFSLLEVLPGKCVLWGFCCFVLVFFCFVFSHKLCVSWRFYNREPQEQQPAAGLSPRLLIES